MIRKEGQGKNTWVTIEIRARLRPTVGLRGNALFRRSIGPHLTSSDLPVHPSTSPRPTADV